MLHKVNSDCLFEQGSSCIQVVLPSVRQPAILESIELANVRRVTPELAEWVGRDSISRSDLTKFFWQYVKEKEVCSSDYLLSYAIELGHSNRK